MLGSSSVYAYACAFCFVLVHLFPLDCTCRGGSRGGGRLVRGGKLASLLEAVGLSFAEVGRRLRSVAGISARSIVRFLGFRGSLGLTHSVWVGSQAYRHDQLSGFSGSEGLSVLPTASGSGRRHIGTVDCRVSQVLALEAGSEGLSVLPTASGSGRVAL